MLVLSELRASSKTIRGSAMRIRAGLAAQPQPLSCISTTTIAPTVRVRPTPTVRVRPTPTVRATASTARLLSSAAQAPVSAHRSALGCCFLHSFACSRTSPGHSYGVGYSGGHRHSPGLAAHSQQHWASDKPARDPPATAAETKEAREGDQDPDAEAKPTWNLPISYRTTMFAGASAAGLAVTVVMYKFTSALMAVSPATTAYYGFYAGFGTSSAVAVLLYMAQGTFQLHPQRAVQLAMKRISKNSDVTALLGWPISPGKIKSYYASTGTVGLKNGYPAWISPVLQMTFTVQGSKADAVVNIVYAKKGYREVVDYLGINWDSDKSGSSTNIVTIPLEGKPKKFSVGEEVRKHNQALIKKNK